MQNYRMPVCDTGILLEMSVLTIVKVTLTASIGVTRTLKTLSNHVRALKTGAV